MMMNRIFDYCVYLLNVWARWTGTTYKEINVWIFVVIWPLATLLMAGTIVYQYQKISQLETQVEAGTKPPAQLPAKPSGASAP